MSDNHVSNQTASSSIFSFSFDYLSKGNTNTATSNSSARQQENLSMLAAGDATPSSSSNYDMLNQDDDVTEKYLTKTPRSTYIKSENIHKTLNPMLEKNRYVESDFFEPSKDEDDITVGFTNQIVVTLLSSPTHEDSSDKVNGDLSETFSKLPQSSSGDFYLNASYSNDNSAHLTSPSSGDNMICAELQIDSDDSPFNEMSFEEFQYKKYEQNEKKQPHNRKGPLPATIGLMEDPVRNLWVTSKWHKDQLKEIGHSWTSGMWSKEETRILKENINRYCQERGIKDPNSIIFQASKEERKDFYPTISHGLNRPLFSVYRRVKRLYDKKNHKGRYSTEEVDKLKRLTKIHGRDWSTIARLLGRSSDSVKDRVRLIKDDLTSGKWTESEEEKLASAVHAVTRTKRGQPVTGGIPWGLVAEMVGNRTEKQCRSKWLNYLNWKLLSGKEWTKEDDQLLVQKIVALNPSTENDINWNEISSGWSSVRSPTWLRKKWSDLKKILHECSLNDINFSDTVKLLDKLFSEDIFKVWDKPKQLVKFLVGVQKARNVSDGSRKELQAINYKRTHDQEQKISTCIVSQPEETSSAPLFIKSDNCDPMLTSNLLTLTGGEASCSEMSEESLNAIVRPRTESESTQSKNEFGLSSNTDPDPGEDGPIILPQVTFNLTPTSSNQVFIMQWPNNSEQDSSATSSSSNSRVVNISIQQDYINSMMRVDGEPTSEAVSLSDATDHEYLAHNSKTSSTGQMSLSNDNDVTADCQNDEVDVSIYVT